jgi:Protein of unknown function (DUF664)
VSEIVTFSPREYYSLAALHGNGTPKSGGGSIQLAFDADAEAFVAFLDAHIPDQAETVQRSITAGRCGANNGPEAAPLRCVPILGSAIDALVDHALPLGQKIWGMVDQKPPRSSGDEREVLMTLLQYQRESLVRKVFGVDEAAARRSPVASGTTLTVACPPPG